MQISPRTSVGYVRMSYVEIRFVSLKMVVFLELHKMGPGGPGPDTSDNLRRFCSSWRKKGVRFFSGS